MLKRIAPIFIPGLILSVLLFLILHSAEKRINSTEFRLMAEGHVAAIQLALDNQVEVMDSVGRLFVASKFVERKEFHDFVQGALDRHRTIKALEWTPRVQHAARHAFIEYARQEGLTGYQITELGEDGELRKASVRPEYFPVYYLEPVRGNETALGFDLGSEGLRQKALALSRDSGRIVATASIGLVQENTSRPGFLMFRPVYSPGLRLDSVEDRRAGLKGFTVGVYIVGDLVYDALKAVPVTGLDFMIEDPGTLLGRKIYFHSSRSRPVPVEPGMMDKEGGGLNRSFKLRLPARQWDITFWPSPAFISQHMRIDKWIVLVLGLTVAALASIFIEINMQRARRNKELAVTLERSLNEKEILLKEVHHRVKNNMAIISSLLRLQARHSDDEGVKSILMDSQNRIRSMAIVHEKLYSTKFLANISFSDYVQDLLSHLFRSYGRKIEVDLDMDVPDLDIDTMIPCGLIMNELVTNSLKHAFDGLDSPRICISLSAADGRMRLVYTDNGSGVPEHIQFPPTDSLGLQIISMLSNQLDGSVELDRTSGTKFTIDFKPYASVDPGKSTNA